MTWMTMISKLLEGKMAGKVGICFLDFGLSYWDVFRDFFLEEG